MTIKDIARESGYAVGTVSRVLNNHPNVSEKARERIMEVVEKNQFQLNENAKRLKQRVSSSIVLIVKGMKNSLFSSVVEHMQKKIEDRGYQAVVSFIDEDDNEVLHAIKIVSEQKPQGIAFLGGNLHFFRDDFKRIGVASILITNSAEDMGFSNLSSIATDDFLGAYRAAELLIEAGHRQIGILGGNLELSHTSNDRFRGIKACFEDKGMELLFDKQYEAARFSLQQGYDGMLRLYEKFPELTAVFAMSDIMAIGAVRALYDKGISVPRDVSVIGFDGIELSRYSKPRLTTICQDSEQMAIRGAEILLDAIENKKKAIHEVVAFEAITGESIAPVQG